MQVDAISPLDHAGAPLRGTAGPSVDGNHGVQFYEDDEFLCDVVADYLHEGLALGEPLVAIATAPHVEGTCARMRSKGTDVRDLCASGRLVFLDAEETLAKFMVGGMPDGERFKTVVGDALGSIRFRGGYTKVRAYGEMVDLLFRKGNKDAALSLEELWNDIARLHSLSLLCAYRMDNFKGAEDVRSFHCVCATHARVAPTEKYGELDSSERLREVSVLQQRARALETEIEHRKRVEQALLEAVRVRDDFLSAAGHELKTPLTVLQLQLQSLLARKDGGREASCSDRLRVATRSAERLCALVEELLDVSRVNSGRLALEREEMDMAIVVRGTVERLAEAAARADCSVRVLAPDSIVGLWDPRRIEQVAQNLVANAIKYGRGKPIDVLVEDAGTGAKLVVLDHGIGISAEDQTRIFDRFERAASSQHFGGLGLGLWIVKQVVDAHGGSLRVDSEMGKGAAFVVELPWA